jgi:hypothetical protein
MSRVRTRTISFIPMHLNRTAAAQKKVLHRPLYVTERMIMLKLVSS